ncbi:MAG TPA: ABC transporter permease [Alphaproteobacteria bacterium]|nr:ABC transporter permease [Alphaproteobacteria bacterium]
MAATAHILETDADAAFLAAERRAAWRRRLLPVAGLAFMLFLWWAVVVIFDVKPFVAPAPQVVAATLYGRFGVLMTNLAPTALEAVLGYLLGNATAILVATAFVHRRTVQEAFFPIAVLINSIPIVAQAPILILLLGNGIAPKVAIAAMICFFPTLVNMVRGLSAVNPQALELMHVLSASKREIFFKLRLQSSLPYLFSALKITASTSVIGAIVGEWIGSQTGLGALIIQATFNFDSALLYATVAVGSCFSITFFLLILALERVCIRWQPAPLT